MNCLISSLEGMIAAGRISDAKVFLALDKDKIPVGAYKILMDEVNRQAICNSFDLSKDKLRRKKEFMQANLKSEFNKLFKKEVS